MSKIPVNCPCEEVLSASSQLTMNVEPLSPLQVGISITRPLLLTVIRFHSPDNFFGQMRIDGNAAQKPVYVGQRSVETS